MRTTRYVSSHYRTQCLQFQVKLVFNSRYRVSIRALLTYTTIDGQAIEYSAQIVAVKRDYAYWLDIELPFSETFEVQVCITY